jgi:endonuclease/exonuclease/phosphatase family metal-dependent hydrolase
MGEHRKHARRPQFEVLADRIWPHFAYGKNAVYTKGHHGNAILSRYPFLMHGNLDISNHRFEKRGILHGTIQVPEQGGRPVHVMTLHLDLLSIGRKKQLVRLRELIEKRVGLRDPLVVAGDFNDWSGEAGEVLGRELGLMEAHEFCHGSLARTYPAAFPRLPLDRIYVRNLEIDSSVRHSGDPWASLSDHLALSAVLRMS